VEALHQLDIAEATIGASPLREGGIAIKILATSGIQLWRSILAVRELLIPQTGLIFPPALQRARTFFYSRRDGRSPRSLRGLARK
jgi:hypothetical protein